MISKKLKSAYSLLNRCITIIGTLPTALFLLILIIGIQVTTIGLFLLYEYQQYGIHIFDISTLDALLHFNFWGHIGHITVLFIIGTSTLFIRRGLEFSLSFTLTEALRGSHISLLTALFTPFRCLKELLRITFIETFGAVERCIDFLSVSNQAKKAKQIFEETLEEEYDQYDAPSGMLLIPITVEEQLPILQGLKLSREMMEQKFGKHLRYNFGLYRLKLAVIGTITAISFIIVHFTFNHDIFPTLLITSILSYIVINSINNCFMILNAATYNHITEKSTGTFSDEDIAALFVNKS